MQRPPSKLPAPPAASPAPPPVFAAPHAPPRVTPVYYGPGVNVTFSFPETRPREPFWASIPPGVKIGGAMGIVLIAVAALFPFGPSQPALAPAPRMEIAPALPAGPADWIEKYSLLPTAPDRTRRVSLIRGSGNLTGFRLELRALIQEKALACAFRVRDPGNFFVMKVLVVRPSADPLVALERFAVIGGRDEPHAQIPLPMQTYLDTPYRVRLEAVGNRFTAWIQDVKVDEWTDSRLPAGGVGISREPGELWRLQGDLKVYPLSKSL